MVEGGRDSDKEKRKAQKSPKYPLVPPSAIIKFTHPTYTYPYPYPCSSRGGVGTNADPDPDHVCIHSGPCQFSFSRLTRKRFPLKIEVKPGTAQ